MRTYIILVLRARDIFFHPSNEIGAELFFRLCYWLELKYFIKFSDKFVTLYLDVYAILSLAILPAFVTLLSEEPFRSGKSGIADIH